MLSASPLFTRTPLNPLLFSRHVHCAIQAQIRHTCSMAPYKLVKIGNSNTNPSYCKIYACSFLPLVVVSVLVAVAAEAVDAKVVIDAEVENTPFAAQTAVPATVLTHTGRTQSPTLPSPNSRAHLPTGCVE